MWSQCELPYSKFYVYGSKSEHSVNLQKWTMLPKSFDVFVEISAKPVCMVTDDQNITGMYNLTTPFSGCLRNVSYLIWHGQMYLQTYLQTQQNLYCWYGL